jgi:hypothetical protein
VLCPMKKGNSNETVLKTGANNALIMHSNVIKISVPLRVTVPVCCGHNTQMSSQLHSGNKHVVIITLSRESEVQSLHVSNNVRAIRIYVTFINKFIS